MGMGVIGNRYRVEERLGAGAMSEVWAAHDTELDRRVALKLLARDADPARFDREARAAAALGHPNIVGLYDYGTAEDGRPYMVLECLSGGTLAERLTPGVPLDDAETMRVARDVAAGLAHAHARGVLHRDLKPGNVLFDGEGRAKIADLGIARMSGEGTLTEAGTVLGTAAYISPEQARGEPASPASDVYSFGVILYLLLTGRLPFEADEPLALVALHATEEPPPVSALRPDAPPVLESVTAAALAKNPADRPQDGSDLLRELSAAPTEVTAIAAPAATAAAAPLPRPRRARAMAVVAGALLLAGGGVGAAYLAAGTGETNEREPTLPEPTVSVPERPTTSEAVVPVEEEPEDDAPATTEATTEKATTGETTTKKATTEEVPTEETTTVEETTPTTTEMETIFTDTLPETEPPPPPATTETLEG